MAEEETLDCSGGVVVLTNKGLRIASVFIILASSAIGVFLPIFLARQTKMPVPKLTFFICKYFGTGVIIATAWMHLLAPAVENLGDPCLADRLGGYPWALAIPLMVVMVMFAIELLAQHFSPEDEHSHSSGSESETDPAIEILSLRKNQGLVRQHSDDTESQGQGAGHGDTIPGLPNDVSYPPGGQDHLGHSREHKASDAHGGLAGQLTAIFILEFGVLFHSVFIGLTLGTTDELVVLLIVLVFHQMFEGLGLGSRLAIAPWPKGKAWLPYVLALGFALSTPLGIAAGIGAKPNNTNTQKLVNGIFDAISAGILMYTGLVELLAHEFMFNPHMRKASLGIKLFAFGCVAGGAGLMALLAKWA